MKNKSYLKIVIWVFTLITSSCNLFNSTQNKIIGKWGLEEPKNIQYEVMGVNFDIFIKQYDIEFTKEKAYCTFEIKAPFIGNNIQTVTKNYFVDGDKVTIEEIDLLFEFQKDNSLTTTFVLNNVKADLKLVKKE